MSAETETRPSAGRRIRPSLFLKAAPDGQPEPGPGASWSWPVRFSVLLAMAGGFVLFGGAALDLNIDEARIGMAAYERLGPIGRVFGGFEPSIWVGRLLPSWLWAGGEGGIPTANSVRWPSAIAGVLIGMVLARRAAVTFGGQVGVLMGLCWLGSIGLMDHSALTGLDLLGGLWVVLALDRMLSKGADLAAGAFAALALLCSGWPPLALIALVSIVQGRAGAWLGWKLLVPPAIAAAAWSAWCLSTVPTEAWAAALALPLTEGPAWMLLPGLFLAGLPWSPIAGLVASKSIRDGLDERGRGLLNGWLQVAGASVVAGTVIPGLAASARVPALAGCALAAAIVCERVLTGGVSPKVRRAFVGIVLMLALAWSVVVILGGGYLAAAVGYYRFLAVTLILVGVPTTALAVFSATRGNARGTWLTLVALAVFLKLSYWGYLAPEYNYRFGQGPWGRAIGQWVPPRWPIYVAHAWPADLAFATERHVYQLVSPQHLAYLQGQPKYVLLLDAEFENWPENAPNLLKVTQFQDEFGSLRVLARTEGKTPWDLPVPSRHSE
jgi:hypothetical protein